MSLDLHPDCQAQLRISLADALAKATARHGMFLTPMTSAHFSRAQSVLPTTGKIHARMQKLIGEAPFVDFVSGTLSRELNETQEFQTEEGPISLSSIPMYADLPALTDRLVSSFNSLPWQYTITAPLPLSFSEVFCPQLGRFDLSDTVSIVCGDDALSSAFPLASGIAKRDQSMAGGGLLASLLIPKNPSLKTDRAYMQIRVEGFIGKYTSTEPLLDAIGVLRAFYGLGLALRLFKLSKSYQTYPQKEKLYIHRHIDDSWVIEELQELESHHSETIRDLKLHDLDGSLDTDAKLASWMKRKLTAMGSVLRASDHASNILLGSQWLLDSHCGSDELLQYVQAAVVVEILLGDKASSDLTGLGELLSNRCAYLIASSHAERDELLQDFRRIYEVRSKIVHRGKSRLLMNERELFGKLRWMCRRIIQEEVELLRIDEDAGNS